MPELAAHLERVAQELAEKLVEPFTQRPSEIWFATAEKLLAAALAAGAREARLDEAREWLMSEGLDSKTRLEWKRRRIVKLEGK